MKSLPTFIIGTVCLLAVSLLLSAPLADAQSATTGIVQSSATSSVVTLQMGNQNVAVAALQKQLIQQGYLSIAAPTGYFGPLTRTAVLAFQKAKGKSQTGMFTILTSNLSAFFAAAATPFVSLYVGSTGSQVKSLQGFLIKQGFLNISTSTTQFGPLTEAALRAFQKAKGLSQTGILDQATFAAMNGK